MAITPALVVPLTFWPLDRHPQRDWAGAHPPRQLAKCHELDSVTQHVRRTFGWASFHPPPSVIFSRNFPRTPSRSWRLSLFSRPPGLAGHPDSPNAASLFAGSTAAGPLIHCFHPSHPIFSIEHPFSCRSSPVPDRHWPLPSQHWSPSRFLPPPTSHLPLQAGSASTPQRTSPVNRLTCCRLGGSALKSPNSKSLNQLIIASPLTSRALMFLGFSRV